MSTVETITVEPKKKRSLLSLAAKLRRAGKHRDKRRKRLKNRELRELRSLE